MRPVPRGASRSEAADQRQLFDLLLQRRQALCHEWRLCHVDVALPADDDLLPARQRVEEALVQVALALERADKGRYGWCVRCRGRIDFQRLLVLPAAARCWPCQESAERSDPGDTQH